MNYIWSAERNNFLGFLSFWFWIQENESRLVVTDFGILLILLPHGMGKPGRVFPYLNPTEQRIFHPLTTHLVLVLFQKSCSFPVQFIFKIPCNIRRFVTKTIVVSFEKLWYWLKVFLYLYMCGYCISIYNFHVYTQLFHANPYITPYFLSNFYELLCLVFSLLLSERENLFKI